MTLTIIMFSHDNNDNDVDVDVEHDAPLIVLAKKVLRWLGKKKVRRVSFSFCYTFSSFRIYSFFFEVYLNVRLLLLAFSFQLLWSHLKWRVYTLRIA